MHSKMSVSDFLAQHPQYAMDRTRPMSDQPRILDPEVLESLPPLLTASWPHPGSGRGRINPNQTLTHKQCPECGYVKRNDLFYVPESRKSKGVLHAYCIDCTKKRAAAAHAKGRQGMDHRQLFIWNYLAPACVVCGFDDHPAAIEMHGKRENRLKQMVAGVADHPTGVGIERLLTEAKRHVPLCSNCHRLLHAGLVALPSPLPPIRYRIVDLLFAAGAVHSKSQARRLVQQSGMRLEGE